MLSVSSTVKIPTLSRILAFRCRSMATIRSSLPHEDRTASEPRENIIEPVILSRIIEVNDRIKLLRLHAVDPGHTIKFSPGQWLDTFIPGMAKAGGFTITSTPSEATPSWHSPAFLELAVQRSTNPPAQWLWRPQDEILGTKLAVRVGGSFMWPPPGIDVSEIDRLVLVAGGVGINPLISIFSHLIRSSRRPREIVFLYATKGEVELDHQRILFLPRLMDLIAGADDPKVDLSLFLTGIGNSRQIGNGHLPTHTMWRRIDKFDLIQAIDGQLLPSSNHITRSRVLCYVCGPPTMTDELVAFLQAQPGLPAEQVLCEKWW